MGEFLAKEKDRLSRFKQDSGYFSGAARANGVYRGKERSFCLAEAYSEENLFAGIRQRCLEYFTAKEIKWHDALNGRPSNHLCDSQVCCVNFLWKYTESYSNASYKISRRGTDRTMIYQHLYAREDFPLRKSLLPNFGALFYEPFYQLFRQQALANEMEIARELGADIVSLLHIVPAQNTDFLRVTSPELRHLGQSAVEVWKKLVKQPSRFSSMETESLFGGFAIDVYPSLRPWWDYITVRYPWILHD